MCHEVAGLHFTVGYPVVLAAGGWLGTVTRFSTGWCYTMVKASVGDIYAEEDQDLMMMSRV